MHIARRRTAGGHRFGTGLVAGLAVLALVVSACGSDSADSDSAPETGSTATDITDSDTGTGTEPVEKDAEGAAAEDADTATEGTTDAGGEETEAADTPTPIETLRVRHPQQLAFSAPFALLDTAGPLGDFTAELDVDKWASPDVLRGILTSGQSDITAVPTYVGANMYNKGVDVHMLAVVVWGLLHVIGPDGTEPDWESLRGKTIMLPFKNDMPDLVFQYLTKANGMTIGEDFQVEYYAQPPEVVAHLAAGTGTWAVLPEHTASLAINKAKQAGVELTRVLDLQSEWGAATGTAARIPQAGIVTTSTFAAEHGDLLAALLDELDRAVGVVNEAGEDTVALLAEQNNLPAPVVASVIPRLNLDVVPADEARAELEAFYTELATLSPEIIGGGLPDEGFYLADPRG